MPAAVLAIASALLVPHLGFSTAEHLTLGLASTAAAATLATVWRHRSSSRSGHLQSVVLAALSVALWTAALVSGQAVAERQQSRDVGWEQTVSDGAPVRLAGSAAGPAVNSPGPFGDRWFVTVEVTGFGHPPSEAPSGTQVQAAGDHSWAEVVAGDRLCFIAVPEAAGSTVFARPRTAPQTGSCEAVHPGIAEGPSGRDRLREGLRESASRTVGTAPQLLPGLILGDRSAQSPELDTAMKDSGLSHLSAVSGANCTLIAGAVTMGLRSLRVRRPVVLASVLATLVVFVIVVGLEPSVIRAAVMGGIGASALFFGRGRQALPLLCVAVCALLCWQPGLAAEAAFQLSVCATAGIVLGARPLERWLTGTLSQGMPGPLAGIFSAALAVTVTAQIACQPVLLGLSGSISAYAVPANLLAAPLVPFVTVPGTVAAALVPVMPALAAVILWWVAWPAAGIGWIATGVASWPGALHPWPEGAVGTVLIGLHILASLALLWLLMRWERVLPARVRRLGWSRDRHRPRHLVWGTRLAWTTIAVCAGSQVAILAPPPGGPVPGDWSLAICDVGQGDMIVLRSGPNSAVVVDTGPEPSSAGECLRGLQVKTIDLLVLTHLHRDHVGGTPAALECCNPDQILYSTAARPVSGGGEDTGSSQAPPGAVVARPGDRGQHALHGWGVQWNVVAADAQATSENDASLVLHVELSTPEGQFSALLTGDLEEAAAARLARSGKFPGSVDVLKASHHGARNGGVDTAEAVQPVLSVISVGADNDYGHPHPQIVGALARYGPVVRTDQHGTAVLSYRNGHLIPTVQPRRTVPSSR